ncbi:SDR family oxidoreductase [Mesobacillus foraminis]|uniref:3-oxoacyl-[acyl-carrier protein] reductase n=1 Tax=Mesobacillus foraminis TaxID=279826 RepID=A0A4R2BNW5_9BACI|nr:SDR family oxidoreductase [Mesobacillus foraminis]TCN27704.1 3-oxoacyl-[acyl-carrier protein] reductase [Mesobacillus foraminis]
MNLQLEGKTAVVAASSQGLGLAIAKELIDEGANVLLSGRHEAKLKQAVNQLGGPGKAAYKQTDLTRPADIEQLIDEAIEKFGSIDILVNNAGGPPAGTFETISDEEWKHAFELNLLSYIRLIRVALPALKARGGKIINIASSSIKEPIPGLILSNTFRTGIVGLTKTLSQELAPYKILINTVAPGRIATDRVKHLDEVNAEKLGMPLEKVEERAKNNIPLQRYGEPEEFAKVVVFLASEANTYMTGSSFLVDGGMVKSI